jgi:hypothetical protein
MRGRARHVERNTAGPGVGGAARPTSGPTPPAPHRGAVRSRPGRCARARCNRTASSPQRRSSSVAYFNRTASSPQRRSSSVAYFNRTASSLQRRSSSVGSHPARSTAGPTPRAPWALVGGAARPTAGPTPPAPPRGGAAASRHPRREPPPSASSRHLRPRRESPPAAASRHPRREPPPPSRVATPPAAARPVQPDRPGPRCGALYPSPVRPPGRLDVWVAVRAPATEARCGPSGADACTDRTRRPRPVVPTAKSRPIIAPTARRVAASSPGRPGSRTVLPPRSPPARAAKRPCLRRQSPAARAAERPCLRRQSPAAPDRRPGPPPVSAANARPSPKPPG